jgi:hypothetical protein
MRERIVSCEAVIVSSESTLHSLHRIKQFPSAVMERFTAIETARVVSYDRAKAAVGTHLPIFFMISDAIDDFSG